VKPAIGVSMLMREILLLLLLSDTFMTFIYGDIALIM
jgi:hypothetical protein